MIKNSRVTQAGFAAIAAIFLVVVLAGLGAAMVTFSTAQQLTSAQDLQGSRAYWAAQAGLEWGLSAAHSGAACPAASTSLTVDGFSVVVSCVMNTYNDPVTVKFIQLTSLAKLGTVGSVGYFERSLSASIER